MKESYITKKELKNILEQKEIESFKNYLKNIRNICHNISAISCFFLVSIMITIGFVGGVAFLFFNGFYSLINIIMKLFSILLSIAIIFLVLSLTARVILNKIKKEETK